ncbi:hypothetical protein BASA81_017754 [Batrachochytrium salamandrivorans]|nr:hypothetical protein BASA81_017754 [Batrachochytrium salamandrivorans]
MSENCDQPDHLELSTAILDQVFSNRDVLISTIKQYFHARNEVVVLDKHSDQRKVTFKCYFGGQYRNSLNLTDDTRKRQTGSHLTSCQFSIRANFSKKKGLWTIGKTNLSHNHPVTDNLGGISTARALTKEEKAIVRDLASSGTGAGSHFGSTCWTKQEPMDYKKGNI